MHRTLLLLLMLIPAPALACKCLVSYPVCREVASSDVVFIGTVESVGPGFLDPWHRTDPEYSIPLDEIERLRRDESPTAAARLKTIYLRMVSGLSPSAKKELESATTIAEVEAAFGTISLEDRRASFKVSIMFREVKDADDDKDKDDKDEKASKDLEVWTAQDDCGIDFQKGETYLVYADNDEETGKLSTSVCYRTKRLSDAGADLAYLHFFQDGGNSSSRIEGFVTSERNQDLGVGLNKNRVESPLPNLVVGMKSPARTVYTRSDVDGRFIFDGLAAGAYELSVFGSLFPRAGRILAGPQRIQLPAKGCETPVLVVSPWDPKEVQ